MFLKIACVLFSLSAAAEAARRNVLRIDSGNNCLLFLFFVDLFISSAEAHKLHMSVTFAFRLICYCFPSGRPPAEVGLALAETQDFVQRHNELFARGQSSFDVTHNKFSDMVCGKFSIAELVSPTRPSRDSNISHV